MQIRREKNNPVDYREQLQDKASEEYNKDKEKQSENLYSAIRKLNEMDRLIISMVLEGIPQKQIGEVLGITENNVNVKVHRIKSQLKEMLLNNQ